MNWLSVRRISGWKLFLVQVAGLGGSIVAEEIGQEAPWRMVPPPPESRLVDAARVFGPDERRAIEAAAAEVPQVVYVVTMEAAAIGAGDYAAHLAKAWIPAGPMAQRGAVMVLEFSARGEQPVFGFSGTWTENAAAAKIAFDEVAMTDAAAGVRAALQALAGRPPDGLGPTQVRRGGKATGFAGAFFVLTTMLFVYQRIKEHLESRARRDIRRAG